MPFLHHFFKGQDSSSPGDKTNNQFISIDVYSYFDSAVSILVFDEEILTMMVVCCKADFPWSKWWVPRVAGAVVISLSLSLYQSLHPDAHPISMKWFTGDF